MSRINASKQEIQHFIDNEIKGKSHEGVAFIIIGGPGSGKSTIYDNIMSSLGFNHKNFVLIDPDRALDTFYNNSETYRDNANQINDLLYETTLQKHSDFIYAKTGRDPEWSIPNIIQRTKKNNYKVFICIVANKIEIAIPRIISRSLRLGRQFSVEHVEEIYKKLETNLFKYMRLDCSDIDGIYVLDNSSLKPELLYTATCYNGIKSIKCYDVQHNYAFVTEFCPFLWKEIGVILSNGAILALISGFLAYYAIIVYKYNWSILLLTSIIVTYCTAKTHLRSSSNSINEMVLISLLTAISIFYVLLYRFNIPESMGIALLSSIITGYTWHKSK